MQTCKPVYRALTPRSLLSQLLISEDISEESKASQRKISEDISEESKATEDIPQYADDSLSKYGMMRNLVDDLDSKLLVQSPTGKT